MWTSVFAVLDIVGTVGQSRLAEMGKQRRTEDSVQVLVEYKQRGDK